MKSTITKEDIDSDPGWRVAIRAVFVKMFNCGIDVLTIVREGKEVHLSISVGEQPKTKVIIKPELDEIARLRDLLNRVQPVLQWHLDSEKCNCDICRIWREVRQVNRETTDAI